MSLWICGAGRSGFRRRLPVGSGRRMLCQHAEEPQSLRARRAEGRRGGGAEERRGGGAEGRRAEAAGGLRPQLLRPVHLTPSRAPEAPASAPTSPRPRQRARARAPSVARGRSCAPCLAGTQCCWVDSRCVLAALRERRQRCRRSC